MFIVYPIKVQFHPDKMKHTGNVLEKLNKLEGVNITGSVKAVVDNDEAQAVSRLIKATIDEYVSMVVNVNPTCEIKDFSLIYSKDKIVDGRVWGPSFTQSVRLK